MSEPKPKRKINVIDVIIIVVVAAALCVVAYKLIQRRASAGTQTVHITYTVRCTNVDKATWESIKQFSRPTQLVSGDYFVADAHVTDCQTEDADDMIEFYQDADNSIHSRQIADKVDVTFTIQATVTDSAVMEISSQEIRIGRSNYYVKTQYYELQGTILTLSVDR